MSFSQDDVIKAAKDNNEAKLREMISEDAAKVLAAEGWNGWTALHEAAINGHTAIVKLLVDAGTNVDAKTGIGCTALHNAALKGHTAIVKLLVDAGADVDAKDEGGWTALDKAEQRGHSETAALLCVRAERELYDALDRDQDGTVTYAELRKGFRGKRKDELRQLAEACGHQWQSLEGRLADLSNTEGFSFQEFEACLSAGDPAKGTLEDRLQALIDYGLEKGYLTDQEFSASKAKLLGPDTTQLNEQLRAENAELKLLVRELQSNRPPVGQL